MTDESTQIHHHARKSFYTLACSPEVVSRAGTVALVVGTILALINHGDKLLSMSFSAGSILQIGLTYLVPYSVSTWSSVRVLQTLPPPEGPGSE